MKSDEIKAGAVRFSDEVGALLNKARGIVCIMSCCDPEELPDDAMAAAGAAAKYFIEQAAAAVERHREQTVAV